MFPPAERSHPAAASGRWGHWAPLACRLSRPLPLRAQSLEDVDGLSAPFGPGLCLLGETGLWRGVSRLTAGGPSGASVSAQREAPGPSQPTARRLVSPQPPVTPSGTTGGLSACCPRSRGGPPGPRTLCTPASPAVTSCCARVGTLHRGEALGRPSPWALGTWLDLGTDWRPLSHSCKGPFSRSRRVLLLETRPSEVLCVAVRVQLDGTRQEHRVTRQVTQPVPADARPPPDRPRAPPTIHLQCLH